MRPLRFECALTQLLEQRPSHSCSFLAIALRAVSDRTYITSIILFVTRMFTSSITQIVAQLSIVYMRLSSRTNYLTFSLFVCYLLNVNYQMFLLSFRSAYPKQEHKLTKPT